MPKTIYLLRDRDRFKIGRTVNFDRRLAAYWHFIPDAVMLTTIPLPDSIIIEEAEARALAAISTAGFKRLKTANREWFVGDAEEAAGILRRLFKPTVRKLDIEPFCRPVPPFPSDLKRRLEELVERFGSEGGLRASTRAGRDRQDQESAALVAGMQVFARGSLTRLAAELGLGTLSSPDPEFAAYHKKTLGPCFRHVSEPVDDGGEHRLDLGRLINGAGGGNIYDHRYRFYVGPIPYAVAAASYVPMKDGFEALPAIEKGLAPVGWRAIPIPNWSYYVPAHRCGIWLFVRNESPDELLTSWRTSFAKWVEDNHMSLLSRCDDWAGDYCEDASLVDRALRDIKDDPFIPIEARSWSYVRARSKPWAEVSSEEDSQATNWIQKRLVARLFV